MALKRYRHKKRVGKKLAPSTRKAVSALVKRQISRAEETKIYSTGSATSSALTRESIYTLSPLQVITQGTGNYNRIGNDIYLQGIKLNMLFQNLGQRQTLFYRVAVLWHTSQWNANWTYQDCLTKNELFYTGSNPMQTPFNTKNTGTTVLYDKVFDMSSTSNNGATLFYKQKQFSKFLKINKRLTYLAGSNILKSKQLYIVIIPLTIDAGSVAWTTSCGAVDMQSLVYYKDA